MTLRCQGGNRVDERQKASRRAGRGAFTLVELLVVIGIIAMLIGILLPTLNRAREAGRASKCLNNMRQITIAAISFAQEHNGWMVGRAGGNLPYNPQTGRNPYSGAVDITSPGNWIAWERQIDPVSGLKTMGNANQNITYSALARYLSVKQKITTTPQEANQVSPKLEELFRCPSDNLALRPFPDKAYRYSYSMNDHFLPGVQGQPQMADTTDYPPPTTALSKGQRNGFIFNGKIGSIRRPSEHLLLVCQDEQRLDDGVFKPNAGKWANNIGDHVAARHEAKFKPQKKTTGDPTPNVNARGNVGFCDGHAEFLSRKEAISQRYSGHPLPDPPGF